MKYDVVAHYFYRQRKSFIVGFRLATEVLVVSALTMVGLFPSIKEEIPIDSAR